jgi:hypothetical protein
MKTSAPCTEKTIAMTLPPTESIRRTTVNAKRNEASIEAIVKLASKKQPRRVFATK